MTGLGRSEYSPSAIHSRTSEPKAFDAVGVHCVDEGVRILDARFGDGVEVVEESGGHGLG